LKSAFIGIVTGSVFVVKDYEIDILVMWKDSVDEICEFKY
jgi:hypothetical protein